jgi:hypothetical protein
VHKTVGQCEAANRLIDVLLGPGCLVSAAIAAAGEFKAPEFELEQASCTSSDARRWRATGEAGEQSGDPKHHLG